MVQVWVVGGANVDVKCHITQKPVLSSSNPGRVETSVGGVARNIAQNCAQLGLAPILVTVLGQDGPGAMIRESCRALGIRLMALEQAQPTGSYLAVLDELGDLVIAVAAMEAMDALDAAALRPMLQDVARGDWVIADANVSAQGLLAVAELCAARGAYCVIEPVSVPKSARLLPLLMGGYELALMSPNRAQLAHLCGKDALEDDELPWACDQLHARGVARLVVGLGPQGVFWSQAKGEARQGHVPSRVTRLVDATGAGDSSLAAVIWALRHGKTLQQAAEAGQVAAAMSAQHAQSVSPLLNADHLTKALT